MHFIQLQSLLFKFLSPNLAKESLLIWASMFFDMTLSVLLVFIVYKYIYICMHSFISDFIYFWFSKILMPFGGRKRESRLFYSLLCLAFRRKMGRFTSNLPLGPDRTLKFIVKRDVKPWSHWETKSVECIGII